MRTNRIVCPKCIGRGHISRLEEIGRSKTPDGDTIAYHRRHDEMCPECSGWGYIEVPITNADKIREMTDEEIAEKLLALEKGELAPESFPLLWCEAKAPGCDLTDPSFVCTDELAKTCILRWLRSPATDE